MDAIVLVGGEGTRLRPLTLTRHKSLIPIANRPAIAYLFDWLRGAGLGRIILALGRGSKDLARAFPARDLEGVELVHVFESQRLESGGAIRNAVREVGVEGRFVVVNGDIYVDFSLAELLKAHCFAAAELTIALCVHDDPTGFGVAVVDGGGMVSKFVEKPPPGAAPSRLVNAGVWLFEQALVGEIPAGPVRVEETLFPALVAQDRKVLGFTFDGTWADLGTPERYLALNRRLLESGRAGQGGVALAADVQSTGADVYRSSVGSGSHLGRGSRVSASVLWEEVEVGAEATITESILADGVRVGAGARVEGAVVGSRAHIAAGARVAPGTKVPPEFLYHGDDGL